MVRKAPVVPWLLAAVLGCSSADDGSSRADAAAQAPSSTELVGYDMRLLRPRKGEPLSKMFERLRKQALSEGKKVAVLFSADWCEQCRDLDLALGSLQPKASIGHIRVLQLKEEHWEAATRMNEFNQLRSRWDGVVDTYPLFVLLDEQGEKIEEMREAIDRLDGMGIEPTVHRWFESVASS